mmetsp:Transcript_118153/g.329473  ORF Transcript_118153/g.329473 Transcript_118153/m.329473 type:complete len:302 (+) Transcript_118153:158-1063(+)
MILHVPQRSQLSTRLSRHQRRNKTWIPIVRSHRAEAPAPGRGAAGRAPRAVQSIQGSNLFLRQSHRQGPSVLLDAGGLAGLRQDDDAFLQRPGESHLRRACVVRFGDPLHGLLREEVRIDVLHDGAVRLHDDLVPTTPLLHIGPRQVRVQLQLVDGWAQGCVRGHLLQMRHQIVAHSDVAHLSGLHERLQSLPDLLPHGMSPVHVTLHLHTLSHRKPSALDVREVREHQVDVGGLQLGQHVVDERERAVAARAPLRAEHRPVHRDLRRDPDLLARDARPPDALGDVGVVLVEDGRVDVPVP